MLFGFTKKIGQEAFWTTPSATLPIIKRSRPVRPCAPRTIRSTASALAALGISLKLPRRKQRGSFDPNGDESICMVRSPNDVGGGFAIHYQHIRASNPCPKRRGMCPQVRKREAPLLDRKSVV